jgi:hypothetical protein
MKKEGKIIIGILVVILIVFILIFVNCMFKAREAKMRCYNDCFRGDMEKEGKTYEEYLMNDGEFNTCINSCLLKYETYKIQCFKMELRGITLSAKPK